MDNTYDHCLHLIIIKYNTINYLKAIVLIMNITIVQGIRIN